jgi:hypothetical protein
MVFLPVVSGALGAPFYANKRAPKNDRRAIIGGISSAKDISSAQEVATKPAMPAADNASALKLHQSPGPPEGDDEPSSMTASSPPPWTATITYGRGSDEW